MPGAMKMISVDGELTATRTYRVFARLYNVPRSERKVRIEEALDMMGLADEGRRLVRHLGRDDPSARDRRGDAAPTSIAFPG
jgi:ABC-type uncharacterized transport system ATPase subunit